MFDSELSERTEGSSGLDQPLRSMADEVKLAIVEYFETVAANPSKFSRQKLQALNDIWARVRTLGDRSAELSERLKTARHAIRAHRERRP